MADTSNSLHEAFNASETGGEWVDDRTNLVDAPPTDTATGGWSGFIGRLTGAAKSYTKLPQGTSATDGVFGNLLAKEEREDTQTEAAEELDDDVTPVEEPPTYEEAAADSTPSYWETTIMSSGWGDEVLVNDLPVGSALHFAWNAVISATFSYVGFFITYLFHTTHAARGGSFVGFGITLIQSSYGVASEPTGVPGPPPPEFHPDDPNQFNGESYTGIVTHVPGGIVRDAPEGANGSLISKVMFFVGILFIIKGFADYIRARMVKAAIMRYQTPPNSEETITTVVEETPV